MSTVINLNEYKSKHHVVIRANLKEMKKSEIISELMDNINDLLDTMLEDLSEAEEYYYDAQQESANVHGALWTLLGILDRYENSLEEDN